MPMADKTDFQYFGTVQIVALILFQIAVTVFLWRLNPVTTNGTALFAIFLSSDLLAFALTSNIYRQAKQSSQLSMKWPIVGYLVLAVLILASIFAV